MTAKNKRKKNKKRMAKVRAKGKHINQHHIRCSSKGGSNAPENIAYVDMFTHQKYHELFGNRNPDEIITYLLDDFWNEQTEWVEKALERYKPKSERKDDNHFDDNYNFFEDEEEDWYQGA